MTTEKLYYADPFLYRFTATVVSCEPAKTGWRVVLDRTAFYPEGGGQPSDHGTLDGIPVTDVHEQDGVIFHICGQAVETGRTVEGVLDWERRFDHMQQHSGEHILSGILCNRFHCDNVGFHLGADTVTIDYNADLSWEDAMEAEHIANAVVTADRAVEIAYPSPEELSSMNYRSKKELTGQVRIVTFPAADCCACCGTHVLRTGQVGLVKILSCQKFRSGVRLEIVCGARALRLLSQAYDQNRQAAKALSVKPDATAAAVERTLAELAAAKVRESKLEDEVFAAVAARNEGRGDVVLYQPPMRPDGVRKLADAVSRTCGGLACVFAGEERAYNYALVRADGADIGDLVKRLNGALCGRGGGRNGFAQGSVQADQTAIETFWRDAV